MTRAMALAALLGLAACGQPAAPVMVDTYCARSSPILISREDVLTRQTAMEILEHNRTYEAAKCPRSEP